MSPPPPNPPRPARVGRRRRILWTVGVSLAAVLAAAQYVRVRYNVGHVLLRARAVMVDWTSIHTDWLVASPEEVQAEIEGARAAWPFGADTLRKLATGPLRVLASNPRWFTDGSGRAIYLTGAHTWSNFQDNGHGNPPPRFDYGEYLDFLEAHHHNFFRLWVTESVRWTVSTPDDDYWFSPGLPYLRTGPGVALDGEPKWDLTQFDDAWFARLRERAVEAGERGVYTSIMLFNGWSVASRKGREHARNPWHGHPFNKENNVNGIDGDTNGDDSGMETHELGDPRVLEIQGAYVRRVIDAVGDLDNVLWEISNESHGGSVPWQYHMIDVIRRYERTRAKQHPVGMTVTFPDGGDEALFASDADWISPRDYEEPPASHGAKVILSDTDHVWGIGGNRAWAWKSFTRGLNTAFMDGYDGAAFGSGGLDFDLADPKWVDLRRNLGYILAYAERVDLARMVPRPELSSTGYCLMDGGSPVVEVLVYAPDGGDFVVDLTEASHLLEVEWFNPATATRVRGGRVAGGGHRVFVPPFEGDAVLYLHQEPRP